MNSIEKAKTIGLGLVKTAKKSLAQNKLPKEAIQPLPAIDFPKEGESVAEGHYTIRLSALPNSEVEISINDGDWKKCRDTFGHWWFDWHPKGTGAGKLIVRSRVNNGTWKKSAARSFQIESSHHR